MSKDDIPAGKRKWHIELELSNGQIQYFSVVMSDLAPYIKKKRSELSAKGDIRTLTPAQPWVFEKVIEECKQQVETFEKDAPSLIYLRISESKTAEGS